MPVDIAVGLFALITIFTLEAFIPFYTEDRRAGRYRHARDNLTLAALGAAVGLVAAPLLVLAERLGAGQGWGVCALDAVDGIGCTIAVLLLFDLWMYAWHRANHRIPLLWRFHRVHHTDPSMDSTTALRFHPGELLLSNLANLPIVVLLGMTLSQLIVYKTLMIVVILFHHSNLAVPARVDRLLRTVIVSPAVHRVHHSVVRSETDSNYGTLFSFWDRLFGSYRRRADGHAIRFGIGAYDDNRWQQLRGLLELPLKPVRPMDSNQAASQEAAP